MKNLPKFLLALTCFLIASVYAQPVQKTDSGYVFTTILPKNISYTFKMTLLTDMDITKNGEVRSSKLNMTMDYGFKVKKQETEFSTVEYKFSRMTMDMSGEGYSVNLDSEQKPTGNKKLDEINKKLKAELKKRKTVEKIWRNGKAEAVEESAKAELTSSVDYNWSNFFFKGGAIKIGDTWSKTGTKKLSGEDFNVSMTYKLVEVNESTSVFSLDADLYKSESTDYDRGTLTGTIIIDNSTGYIRDQTLDVNLSMGENYDKLNMKIRMLGQKVQK